jgi:DNA-binding protein H-NS
MPRKAQLPRILAQIRQLEAKAAALQNAEKEGLVQLRAVLKKYKLDISDVKKAFSSLGKPVRSSKLKGKKIKPKYRNPANKSETWAGRGREPKWFTAAIKAGKTREQLTI